jgi:hypothetical protein
MDLPTLINDYNGAAFLQPGTAEWGFVDEQWYLHLPDGANIAGINAPTPGTSQFDNNLNAANFMKANYARLAAANALNNADKALFATLLRYHMVANGLLCGQLARRGVIESEYRTQDHLGANWDDNLNAIANNANRSAIARYVKKYGDTIIQIMVYVFCSRGHHWQDEYNALYDRLMTVCGIQRPIGWAFPDNRELFRQIFHCFGIRIPLEFVTYCANNNRMINPMRIRFTPHAPVAGAAQILTLEATLREMQSEAWWNAFRNKFAAHVQNVTAEVALITANPYEYHVASRVLTGANKRILTANAIQSFTVLSQYALGYIDHLGRRHSLFNQKVITSKSGGMKPVADSFSKACDTLGKPNVNVPDMLTFINNL